jgi:hypothetical protein
MWTEIEINESIQAARESGYGTSARTVPGTAAVGLR